MNARDLTEMLKENGVNFFTGVPCSVLSGLIKHLEENETYISAVNEGQAAGTAAGALLGGKFPAVVMQNDGLFNALNPVTSLLKLYEIPALLIISWRGAEGNGDPPQHNWSGKTLFDILKAMQIDYHILEDNAKANVEPVRSLVGKIKSDNGIGAIVVRKGILAEDLSGIESEAGMISRERAVRLISELIPDDTAIISTTGKISRELLKHNNRNNNFYMTGSMGVASSIALGYQKAKNRPVVVLDGDGALLMHMGALANNGFHKPEQFLHICLDNGVYETTGSQKTVSEELDFSVIAAKCGYVDALKTMQEEQIISFTEKWVHEPQLSFMHVKVNNETSDKLPRPEEPLSIIKERFIEYTKKL